MQTDRRAREPRVRWKTAILATFSAAMMLVANMVPPAFAQTPETTQAEGTDSEFYSGCKDEHVRRLCDKKLWANAVAVFGLEPAELAQRKGIRGVRVFTFDAFSNDMPVVSILTSGFDAEGEPENAELEVRRQHFRDESKAGPRTLRRDAWPNLYERAADLQELVRASSEKDPETDRTAQSPSDDGRQVVVLCADPWGTVVESLTDQGVTRRIRQGCVDDALADASWEMSAQALRGFPYCNHLDPENYRNEATQLQRCFSLQGTDKIAAAEVTNLFDASIDVVADLGPYLAPDVHLTWVDHVRVSGAAAVSSALTDPAFKDFDLYAGFLAGASNRVVASGWLEKSIKDGFEAADIESTWRRRDNAWRISDIVIGPMKIEK